MDVPGIVEEELDGEDVATRVDLGGDDELYVTATRTLIYRSEGLLSDESVESYDHDAERVTVSEGRRKSRVTLTYPIDGTADFTLPASSADAAIPPILAGVLNANGVIEPGETVLETFLFSELTLVLTEDRLVKHIGEAVWDKEFEEYHFGDVTGIAEEPGSVATQLVLTVDGRTERFKTPNDRAAEVRQRLEEAIRAHHGLGSNEDITAALSPEDEEDDAEDDGSGGMSFEDGVDPLSAGDTTGPSSDPDPSELDGPGSDDAAAAPSGSEAAGASAESGADGDASGGVETVPDGAARDGATGASGDAVASAGAERAGDADAAAEAGDTSDAADARASEQSTSGDEEAATAASDDEAEDAFEAAGFEPADESDLEVSAELAELREVVEKQNRLLAKQQRTIEQLIEELRRGR